MRLSDNESSDDIPAYGYDVLHTGFDRPFDIPGPRKPCDIQLYRHAVSHTGLDPFDIPGPTSSKLRQSQARSHVRRPSHMSEDDEDYGDPVYGHGVPHPGFDPFDTQSDSDGNDHGPLSNDSADDCDSDPSEALAGSGANMLLVVVRSLKRRVAASTRPESHSSDTDHDEDLDIAPPSGSNDGYDSDLSEALFGLDTDHDANLSIATQSDPEEELLVSPHNSRPHSQEVLTISLKHTSNDLDRERARGRPDIPPSLPAAFGTDVNDTAPILDEDDVEHHGATSPSSHETSDSDDDEDEDSDLGSSSSDSDGDQEQNTHLGDALPNSEESWDAPLSSSPLDPSEDLQVVSIRIAATSPHQVAHVCLDTTYSVSDKSEVYFDFDQPQEESDPDESEEDSDSDQSEEESEEDLVRAPTHVSIDEPPEDEGEVDDTLGQEEEHTIIPLITRPEKLETASTIAPAVSPSRQEDVTGPGDSKTDSTASHNAFGTEIPDPQLQPSSSAKPSPSTAVSRIKGRGAVGTKRPFYLYPGLFARRKVGKDDHPHLISQIVLHNGIPAVIAHPCTSRPTRDKYINQYGKQTETHFCFLGGIEGKSFHNNDIPPPEKGELDTEGPPMPYKTYIKLKECKPFDPNDFVPFRGSKHKLPPKELKKFLDLYNLHGCKKSPTGSVLAAQLEILMSESSI
ncbi:hypothetical protein NW767_005275 [Fusarium falciforme]|nr:hypothetical protein NW767_005275 [Fusarium falciforme]